MTNVTLRDLINFCTDNKVKLSIGFDPAINFITLLMRRGSNFQVDYCIVDPDEVINYDIREETFKSVINGMLRKINERERQTTNS